MLLRAISGVICLVVVAHSVDPSCNVMPDVDIDPHTPGLGHQAAVSIDRCCDLCRSQIWWERGCRFSTLSKGNCWFKADNKTAWKSPGKTSVECTSPAPPPPPPPKPPPKGVTGAWHAVGPMNIGDDIYGQGEAGTFADSASPPGNPNLIYAGGQNNGASSGVWKTTDRGFHWQLKSNGLYNTRVEALGIVDDKGDNALVAVQGAMYETKDQAETWQVVPESVHFGTCNTIKNGSINGEPVTLAGCSVGLANRPKEGGNWSIIPWASSYRTYFSVSDSDPRYKESSVVGACLGSRVHIGHIINTTHANWTEFSDRPCSFLAMDPNNADQFIYTKPPLTYHSKDGGKTYESLNHSNIMFAHIDRRGWFYTAAMGGAFWTSDQGHHWNAYYDVRHQRRTGRNVSRVAHDYQRISGDFGGGTGVAFPSDQGLAIKPPGNTSELINANGNLSNNIALSPSVSYGDGPGKEYVVTAMWDWAPVASWDSGAHWPSWQTKEDGMSGSCIGEGGGTYAFGKSNHMLLMHHHNCLHSPHGGKNLTRFVMPHGACYFGPTYAKLPGSRSEPNGAVFAPVFMGAMPWYKMPDKIYTCSESEYIGDLGVHTNFSCLAAVDLGVSYGWYKGVTYSVWRGDTDKHCYICNVSGNSSLWNYTDAKGAYSYPKQGTRSDKARQDMLDKYDMNNNGRIDADDLTEQCLATELSEDSKSEVDDDDDSPSRLPDGSDIGRDEGYTDVAEGSLTYIGKNFNYGYGNWTWSELPPFAQGVRGFVAGMSDSHGKYTIYGISTTCIVRSFDTGDTWQPGCWNGTNLTGSIRGLVIKDLMTMIVLRNGQVPLRTKDGGETWQPMHSLDLIATWSMSAQWSWSGKTLALSGGGGAQNASWHPHTGYVWLSKDDGDTWTDETDVIVTNSGGISQWYEGDLYMGSSGNGIFKKTMEKEELATLVI